MGGVIDTIFGGGGGAAASAMRKQLEEAMRQRQSYGQSAENAISPFTGGGNGPIGLQQYQGEINKLLNPTSFMNNILSNYQQSPFATNQIQEGTRALEHSASAGGLLHSSDTANAIQQNAQRLSSQDMQQYLQNALGIYGQGFGGLGGLENQGYGSSMQLSQNRIGEGQDIVSILSQLGKADAQGELARSGGIQNLMSTILSSLTGGIAGGLGQLPGIKPGWGGAFAGATGIGKFGGGSSF